MLSIVLINAQQIAQNYIIFVKLLRIMVSTRATLDAVLHKVLQDIITMFNMFFLPMSFLATAKVFPSTVQSS